MEEVGRRLTFAHQLLHMPKPYSQAQALWAITRASFKAIFNQPIAIFFSLLFPFIFILIFGAFGNRGGVTYRIGIEPGSDTTNEFYLGYLKSVPMIRIMYYPDTIERNKDLLKGRIL